MGEKKNKKHFTQVKHGLKKPIRTQNLKKGINMNFLDLAVLALASATTLIFFVSKTNIERSRVPVKVRTKK
jgi:hypothetical protein